MATFAGRGGKVQVGVVTVLEIDEWDLSINADLNEITSFGDVAKRFQQGVYEWNGSFKGRLDTTDATGQATFFTDITTAAAIATLRLFGDATKNYNGTAWIKTLAPKAVVSGEVDVTYTFQGSGPLVFTP